MLDVSTVSPEAIELINQYRANASTTNEIQTKITIIAVCIVIVLIIRGFLLDSKGFADIKERILSWWCDFKHMIKVISQNIKKKKGKNKYDKKK